VRSREGNPAYAWQIVEEFTWLLFPDLIVNGFTEPAEDEYIALLNRDPKAVAARLREVLAQRTA